MPQYINRAVVILSAQRRICFVQPVWLRNKKADSSSLRSSE